MTRVKVVSLWTLLASVTGAVGAYGGGSADAAEPVPGAWTAGAAVGFLSNEDATAFAINANVETFLDRSFSVGPLLQIAVAPSLTQVGVSGQVKYWLDLGKGLKLTPQGGIGFVHTNVGDGDTSFLIPLGVGVDYALNRNVSATATFLLNLTHLSTSPAAHGHVMPSLTFGFRF